MALDLNMVEEDLDYIIQDLPVTATFEGNTYTGTLGDVAMGGTLLEEGMQAQFDQVLTLKVSAFDDASPARSRPAVNKLITVAGTKYQIDRVELDAAEIAITLFLTERTR